MKDLIKEVALDIANKLDPERAKLGGDFQFGFNTVQLFAELVVAELSKRAEAVAYDVRDSNGDGQTVLAKYVSDPDRLIAVTVTKLFTFPPIHDIEAIENRTAEACAKLIAEKYMPFTSDWFTEGKDTYVDKIRSGEWRNFK